MGDQIADGLVPVEEALAIATRVVEALDSAYMKSAGRNAVTHQTMVIKLVLYSTLNFA